MNVAEQAYIARLEAENAGLRAENASLQTLCERLTILDGKQQAQIAALQAGRVSVPILGTLQADRRIPQP